MGSRSVEIPNRELFKAAEVCEIAQLQPFILRSWETEFPHLGTRGSGGSRVYRRSDLEQILRIKQLLFVDGLTLAGVRRRLEEERKAQGESAEAADASVSAEELVARDARRRIEQVRADLRSLLNLLSSPPAPWARSASEARSEGRSEPVETAGAAAPQPEERPVGREQKTGKRQRD